MPTLDELTTSLLESAQLEPAEWLDDDNDEDAGKLVPLAKLGLSASSELVEYMKLAERPAFRKKVAAVLQEGAYWGVHQVRSPSSLLFRETSSNVVAFLAGTIPIANDPDSGAHLVVAWKTDASRSAVASFLFNDVAPSDPEPRDFVVEALSLGDYLRESGNQEKRPDKSAPICQELSRLYRRGIWIAQIVQGDARKCDLDEIEAAVRAAAAPQVYEQERSVFDTHPHYAAYWLLSHALFDHGELLADALEHSRTIKHPAVVDLRKQLRPVAEKKVLLADVFSQFKPKWTAKELTTVRRWGTSI